MSCKPREWPSTGGKRLQVGPQVILGRRSEKKLLPCCHAKDAAFFPASPLQTDSDRPVGLSAAKQRGIAEAGERYGKCASIQPETETLRFVPFPFRRMGENFDDAPRAEV